MMAVIGILGAAALFALFGYSATRRGTRLEGSGGCHGGSEFAGSCSLQDECDGCGDLGQGSGWWPAEGVNHGDRP